MVSFQFQPPNQHEKCGPATPGRDRRTGGPFRGRYIAKTRIAGAITLALFVSPLSFGGESGVSSEELVAIGGFIEVTCRAPGIRQVFLAEESWSSYTGLVPPGQDPLRLQGEWAYEQQILHLRWESGWARFRVSTEPYQIAGESHQVMTLTWLQSSDVDGWGWEDCVLVDSSKRKFWPQEAHGKAI